MTTEYKHELFGEPVLETQKQEAERQLFEEYFQTLYRRKKEANIEGRAVHFHLLKKIASRTDLSDAVIEGERKIFGEIYSGQCNLDTRIKALKSVFNIEILSKPESVKQPPTRSGENLESNSNDLNRDFSFLLLLGQINSIAGWLLAIASVVIMVAGGIQTANGHESLPIIIGGAILLPAALCVLATGQMIYCFVSIERNGHDTNMLLKQMLKKKNQ